ncbi:hypothetical protein MPSEU_001075300 [Mayamaea pseudoterrestris]|nr:hypothetical protein MPSEU_001075300 [Mayamaea pseudoterrestris]
MEMDDTLAQQQQQQQQQQHKPQPKTIKYRREADEDLCRTRLHGNEGYNLFLNRNKAICVKDEAGREVYDFENLRTDATYMIIKKATTELCESEDIAWEAATLANKQFEISTLPQPHDVPLPSMHRSPEFICEAGWIEQATQTIAKQFHLYDDGERRVAPVALVGCSRRGKTRCLVELAHTLRRFLGQEVAVLYISFSSYSMLRLEEQADPLQALCLRIIFEATIDPAKSERKAETFESFLQEQYTFNPAQVQAWLGSHPAILLLDGLDQCLALKEYETISSSTPFGWFLRYNFVSQRNRSLVFTSEVITTLNYEVILQEMPHVYNLSLAQRVNPSLNTVWEAARCGFIPALMYEQRRGGAMEQAEWREVLMNAYNAQSSANPTAAFSNLLESFITGEERFALKSLHCLLEPYNRHKWSDFELHWIPLHMEYVLANVKLPDDCWQRAVADELVVLLERFFSPHANESDSWAAGFVFMLVLRCAANRPDDYFLPKHWWYYVSMPQVQVNSFDGTLVKSLFKRRRIVSVSDCKSWRELTSGICVGNGPTIVILYAANGRLLGTYDVLVLFYNKEKVVHSLGFLLNDGSSEALPRPMSRVVFDNFIIQADTGSETALTRGWEIASENALSKFYGKLGRHWTPTEWNRLKSTLPEHA